jgi:hypothetical protein
VWMFPFQLSSSPQRGRPPLPPRGGGCGLRPWRVVGVPLWSRPSSARRSGGAPFSLPLTALSQEKRKGKTAMGVGSLDVRVSSPSLAFEPWRRNRRGESPKLPRL